MVTLPYKRLRNEIVVRPRNEHEIRLAPRTICGKPGGLDADGRVGSLPGLSFPGGPVVMARHGIRCNWSKSAGSGYAGCGRAGRKEVSANSGGPPMVPAEIGPPDGKCYLCNMAGFQLDPPRRQP